MSWISDFLEPIDYRTSRIIYEYLRSSKTKSFGKLTIDIGRETILEVEWMGYSPTTANRHTHCRIKTGRINDVVIPIAEIPAFTRILRESMEHKAKATSTSPEYTVSAALERSERLKTHQPLSH